MFSTRAVSHSAVGVIQGPYLRGEKRGSAERPHYAVEIQLVAAR